MPKAMLATRWAQQNKLPRQSRAPPAYPRTAGLHTHRTAGLHTPRTAGSPTPRTAGSPTPRTAGSPTPRTAGLPAHRTAGLANHPHPTRASLSRTRQYWDGGPPSVGWARLISESTPTNVHQKSKNSIFSQNANPSYKKCGASL